MSIFISAESPIQRNIRECNYFRVMQRCIIIRCKLQNIRENMDEILMKKTKTITLRLDEEEHEKLMDFAKKQKLSVNNIVRKAIALNFNFKTKDVVKTSEFLTTLTSETRENSPAEKAMLYASIEALVILRELAKKEDSDWVKNAQEIARRKVDELMG